MSDGVIVLLYLAYVLVDTVAGIVLWANGHWFLGPIVLGSGGAILGLLGRWRRGVA